MATPTTDTNPTPRTPRRRTIEELSPEAWLLKVAKERPELVDEKDFRFLSSIAPASVLAACTERYLPMIWSKVLFPTKRQEMQPRATGEAEFQAFIDVLWVRYRKMTGAQARSEAGALVTVFARVRPKQLVEQAMTREQFGERFAAARGG